jgi:arylsulfatase A-like enzyme
MNPLLDRRSLLKLLALLPLTSLVGERIDSSVGAKGPAQNREAANVLILVFDALSAKHMSLYGYERETTPNLDKFAQQSTVFHANYAAGNFTTPGTASLLTGVYPWSHRALHFLGKATDRYEEANIFGLFASKGYRTIAYTHNPLANVLLHQFREHLGLFKQMRDLCLAGQQFAEQLLPGDFDTAIQSEWLLLREAHGELAPASLFLSLLDRTDRHFLSGRLLQRESGELFPRGVQRSLGEFEGGLYFVLDDAIDWIAAESSRSPQPFLGYFHLMPPHEPYNPRREFIGLFEDSWEPVAKPAHFFSTGHSDGDLNNQRKQYDEHVAYADAEFGRLHDMLAQSNLLDNTCVVVTSDHGEMFERGIQGHWTEVMYEPIIRIPLLISGPGQHERQDVHVPTSAVDLLPTLLHVAGYDTPDWCEGQVLPLSGSRASNSQSILSIEAKGCPRQGALTRATVALIKDRYKLIHYSGYNGYENQFEMYDLANDPEEMEDLYAPKRPLASDLQDELEEKLREVNRPYLRE